MRSCAFRLAVLIVAVLAAWIVGLGCWPVVIWSPLNCSHEDIDVNSGRVRHQRYLLGLRIRKSVEKSSLSRLLADEVAGQPEYWRRVNTFSPLVGHSPHYLYHGAIAQVYKLEMLWDFAHFTPEAKRQTARDVLAFWQKGEGYFLAGDYLRRLESLADSRQHTGQAIDVKDLPVSSSAPSGSSGTSFSNP